VDLLIADPPYNRRKVYGETAHRRMAEEEYARWTKQWLSLALPLLKPTGTIYFCCDWQTSMIVGPILTEMTHVRNRITWQREKGRGARTNWKNAMEDIWFATLSDTYTFHRDAVRLRRRVRAPYRENGIPKDWKETPDGAFRDTCPSNFWDDITVPFWSMAENTSHPTQKPEKLMARLILASTDPVALDQACVDLIYQAEGNESLVDRMESLHGIHTLEHAEEIGLGSRTYKMVNIDD
jgi:site-specific DNA-methyltransferase (adenine-specific)